MLLTSLRFHIAKGSYQQVVDWQNEIDESVLRYQIETRGQALVTPRDKSGDIQKVSTLPDLAEFEPYYGTQGGAYRYSFHPLNDACELEVVNQMGGFAFYYPRRFDPLHLYLFQPPELVDHGSSDLVDLLEDDAFINLYENNPATKSMIFSVSPPLFNTFREWPWSRRSLHAYDFIFYPGKEDCQLHVRSRESGVLLELTQEVTL